MFLGPFLLGGITGVAVAPWIYGYGRPAPYPYYSPYYYPRRGYYW
jgi:hypothetical protein